MTYILEIIIILLRLFDSFAAEPVIDDRPYIHIILCVFDGIRPYLIGAFVAY